MPATPRALDLAVAAGEAAADKQASDVVILDVSDRLVITDCFVIAGAANDRQVQAVVEEVERRLRALGAKPLRREGLSGARWVLLDFLDIVVHIQHDEDRAYYALERLWKDCPQIARPGAALPNGRPAPMTVAPRG